MKVLSPDNSESDGGGHNARWSRYMRIFCDALPVGRCAAQYTLYGLQTGDYLCVVGIQVVCGVLCQEKAATASRYCWIDSSEIHLVVSELAEFVKGLEPRSSAIYTVRSSVVRGEYSPSVHTTTRCSVSYCRYFARDLITAWLLSQRREASGLDHGCPLPTPPTGCEPAHCTADLALQIMFSPVYTPGLGQFRHIVHWI
ncbi:hypothetical protein J6590_036435 [Homalodisca vitripennis]|nr:hypothetical protein J6590_036435 [Homalodisca vitripennis]